MNQKPSVYDVWRGSDTLEVVVITDMPLLPWFDQYLKDEWAKHKIHADICRVAWEDRKNINAKKWKIYWPSRERFCELNSEEVEGGVLVVPDMINRPLNQYYGNRLGLTKSEMLCMTNNDCIDLTGILYHLLKEGDKVQSDERWGDVYSDAVQKRVAESCFRIYASRWFRQKKVLIADCDGVLWPGIVAEDGQDGVFNADRDENDRHRRFQEELVELVQNGILLCLCSKNERSIIMKTLEINRCVLSERHIAADSISMRPKSTGVSSIIEALNVSPRDVIFLDDDEREINEIREHFPEMTCIKFEIDTVSNLLISEFFLLPEGKENALKRLRSYQENISRKKELVKADRIENILCEMETEIRIGEMKESEIDRVLELSHRTNKCTNGIRMTRTKVLSFQKRNYSINTVYVSDKYGDLGLVGAFIVDEDNTCLELFCLSCRALGRGIEEKLLEEIQNRGVTQIVWVDTFNNSWLLSYCSSLFKIQPYTEN